MARIPMRRDKMKRGFVSKHGPLDRKGRTIIILGKGVTGWSFLGHEIFFLPYLFLFWWAIAFTRMFF